MLRGEIVGGGDVAPDMYLRRRDDVFLNVFFFWSGSGWVGLRQVWRALVQPLRLLSHCCTTSTTTSWNTPGPHTLTHSHTRSSHTRRLLCLSPCLLLIQTHAGIHLTESQRVFFCTCSSDSQPAAPGLFSLFFLLSVEYFPSQLNLGFLTGSWALDTGNKKSDF